MSPCSVGSDPLRWAYWIKLILICRHTSKAYWLLCPPVPVQSTANAAVGLVLGVLILSVLLPRRRGKWAVGGVGFIGEFAVNHKPGHCKNDHGFSLIRLPTTPRHVLTPLVVFCLPFFLSLCVLISVLLLSGL